MPDPALMPQNIKPGVHLHSLEFAGQKLRAATKDGHLWIAVNDLSPALGMRSPRAGSNYVLKDGEHMEKKEISITIRLTPQLHKSLKMLAAKEGKTAKECLLEGLDKAFPGWKEEGKK